MKAKDLYKRPPIRIAKEIDYLSQWSYTTHLEEIHELHYTPVDHLNERVSIHFWKEHCFDSRRVWILAGVKLDDDWVMIIQNAGREGDDHCKRFITDKEKFKELLEYVRSLLPVDEENIDDDCIPLDMDVKDLDTFYGCSLDNEF